ncbi:3-oxo-tetronate kinase [Agaribacter flavus]|uniref:3-oxo-tetronate kinase n=1 Tax=Agaribacter flavus TaxID=1902781 RepID=A0ABV7FLI5_9ALTE
MVAEKTKKEAVNPILGCIADDFTGASDMASFLRKGGLNTIQINGVPDETIDIDTDVDAIVIALKTRTCDKQVAINESLRSLSWLQEKKCHRFYFKYCSTFDSTETGNIGPVIDALMDAISCSQTLVCPALPVNGRTVYNGHLFVHGELLNRSPMADHPLTPMKDSDLSVLLNQQVAPEFRGTCGHIRYPELSHLDTQTQVPPARYIIADALDTEHLRILANYFATHADFPLLTGGSGLAEFLGQAYRQKAWLNKTSAAMKETRLPSPVLIIAGSCSKATQGQVAHIKSSIPSLNVDPNALVSGEQDATSIEQWLSEQQSKSVILYSTDKPENVSANQEKLGQAHAAEIIEHALAAAARYAAKSGQFRNIIVAGGETSGAVVSALNIKRFVIGESVAPGVPLMRAQTVYGDLQLALKSGNFGDFDFFSSTMEAMTL